MIARRSTAPPAPQNGADRSSLRALESEHEFLEQSIEDLERERELGEVDATDFEILQSRYRGRLQDVKAEIAGLTSSGTKQASDDAAIQNAPEVARLVPPGSRWRRRLGSRRVRLSLGIAATCCFVAAASLLAASLAGVRLPGESATGSVSLSTAQQEQETLDRAAILGSEGQVAEAVQLYDEVLQKDPDQPDALAYGGWLVRLAGLAARNRVVLARGDASVARAVKVAPGFPDGHALYGVVLYLDYGRPKASVTQFRDALRTGASEELLSSVAGVAEKAFAAAKEPLPEPYRTAARSATGQGG